jgi:hypothetical protein
MTKRIYRPSAGRAARVEADNDNVIVKVSRSAGVVLQHGGAAARRALDRRRAAILDRKIAARTLRGVSGGCGPLSPDTEKKENAIEKCN